MTVEGQSTGRSRVQVRDIGRLEQDTGVIGRDLPKAQPGGPSLGISGIPELDGNQHHAGGNVMIQGKAKFTGGI